MKKWIYIFSLLTVAPQFADAQYYWDYGIKLGGANYLGEMGGKDRPRRDWIHDIKLNQTRWLAGGYVRYKISNSFSANLGFTYARIQGRDDLSTYAPRYARNLHFRNDMFELSLRGEYSFYNDHDVGNKGRYIISAKYYAFGGVAGFYHNPKAQNGGQWVALQPLQTEGVKYSRFQFSLPLGVGLNYTYYKKWRIGWEFSWMTTFTDYMDDASTTYADPNNLDPLAAEMANRTDELDPNDPIATQLNGPNSTFNDFYGTEGAIRGDPTHDDAYLFTAITIGYVIRGKSSIYRKKYNFVYGGQRRKRRTRAKF